MATGTDDYAEQWARFLSYGSCHFSKSLLTFDTALIVSSDLSKIAVIEDDENKSACEYDEQERVASIDLRFVRWCGEGISASFNCPACERFHAISFVDSWEQEDWGTTCIHKICIHKDMNSFECVCGVEFVVSDSRKFLRLPFDLRELTPLYQVGMPRDVDLLLRYVLGPDGRSLVEEIGVVPRYVSDKGSLTDDPLRKFYWTVPPSFMSESKGVLEGVLDVKIWRRRIYVLGCDRFAELTRNRHSDDYERVDRYIRGKYEWSALAFTSPDELLSNLALLESIVIADRLPPGTWGGRHNVKVADLPEPTRSALGKRYKELGKDLTNVKQAAKAAFELNGEGWRKHILKKYPVLKKHRDLLEAINVYGALNDAEGSGGKAPWEVAIEIAAREVIPDYKSIPLKKRPSADTLKRVAIIPKEKN